MKTETISTTDSPTSPFANKMVDDLIETIKSEGQLTARSDQSESITQITESGDKSGTILKDIYLLHQEKYVFKLVGTV